MSVRVTGVFHAQLSVKVSGELRGSKIAEFAKKKRLPAECAFPCALSREPQLAQTLGLGTATVKGNQQTVVHACG